MKKMRVFKLSAKTGALAVMVSGLAGCMTPQTLAEQPPRIVLAVSAPLIPIRDCVAKNTAPWGVITPFKDGWLMGASALGFTNFSVVMLPVGSGTRIEVRMAPTLSHAGYYDAVEPCLAGLPQKAIN